MKKFFKEEWGYLLFAVILITVSLMLVTVNKCYETTKLVNFFTDSYGQISLAILSIFGITYFFLLRNIDKKQTDLSKVFLWIAIPIGLLYCVFNPLGRVPDERSHAFRAYEISQRPYAFISG